MNEIEVITKGFTDADIRYIRKKLRASHSELMERLESYEILRDNEENQSLEDYYDEKIAVCEQHDKVLENFIHSLGNEARRLHSEGR